MSVVTSGRMNECCYFWENCFILNLFYFSKRIQELMKEKIDNFHGPNLLRQTKSSEQNNGDRFPKRQAQHTSKNGAISFKEDFGVDPLTLDVHNYDSPLGTVTPRLLFDRCQDSSLPFYFPWLMIDEADVVLIFPENSSVIEERIERHCPSPISHPNRACLLYVRCGQFLKEGRSFVSDTLDEVMTKRNQKFVLGVRLARDLVYSLWGPPS